MLDFLFKLFFSYGRNIGERGAAAASIGLSIPLGLNISLILLFFLSFLVDIKDLGALAFTLLTAVTCLITGLLLRYRYVVRGRYKQLKYRYVFFYYFGGFIYLIVSGQLFLFGGYLLFESGTQ